MSDVLAHPFFGATHFSAISGRDRAMLYILAGWTGFRKGEIGSLTRSSFRLDTSPATATVAAAYSKRRRQDTQILRPDVATELRTWIAAKGKLAPDAVLFPISKRAGKLERKTCKMIREDLKAARAAWLKDARNEREREDRAETDFLCYENQDGLYADFHSLRHFFITSPEKAGVSPKMAQTLARHSDIRLTPGITRTLGCTIRRRRLTG